MVRHNWLKAFTLVFIFAMSCISLANTTKIYGVEVERHRQYDNYYVKTNCGKLPKAMMLGNRLVLDFKGVKVVKSQKIMVEKSSRVASIRIGQFSSNPLIARVVFDLKREITYETASLFGKGKMLVEISDSGTAKPSVAKKDPQKIPKSGLKVKQPKLLPIAKKSVKQKKINKLTLKGKIIIVDPGHGGDDPGAIGPRGIKEKNINLKTAKYLAAYLKERGAKVYLTRKSDIRCKLKDIVNFANRKKGDVYIGVHFNSIDNPKISGTETHYYTPQSYKLASAVHRKLLYGIRRQDRGIKRTMLYTIHHAKMPAIIVEPIYMTHFQDGLLINSKSFQKEVARDIALGIEAYFNGR